MWNKMCTPGRESRNCDGPEEIRLGLSEQKEGQGTEKERDWAGE